MNGRYTARAMEQEQTAYQEAPNRPTISFPGAPPPKKKNVGARIIILIALLLVIGGIAWFLLSGDNPFSGMTPSPSPTIAVRELPTNTPIPTEAPVSKEELKVTIQNGTGIPGEASFLQKELEKLGFKSIETGNADNKNYTKTMVSFGSKVPDEIKSEVAAKLQELYTSVDISDTASAGVDVLIITGPRKGQKATSAPTSVRGAKTSVTPTKSATTTSGNTPTGIKSSTTPTPQISN